MKEVDIAYPSSSVSIKAKTALMVCWTLHQGAPLPTSTVRLCPLRSEPPVHNYLPATDVRIAPPRRNLHDIKHVTYKIILRLLNLTKENIISVAYVPS